MGEKKIPTFTIPSVAEIKEANKISASGTKPSVFKKSSTVTGNEKKAEPSTFSSSNSHQYDTRTSANEANKTVKKYSVKDAYTHRRVKHSSNSSLNKEANQTISKAATDSNKSTLSSAPIECRPIPISSTASHSGEMVASKNAPATSRSVSANSTVSETAQYRPHAIVANIVQVSFRRWSVLYCP